MSRLPKLCWIVLLLIPNTLEASPPRDPIKCQRPSSKIWQLTLRATDGPRLSAVANCLNILVSQGAKFLMYWRLC